MTLDMFFSLLNAVVKGEENGEPFLTDGIQAIRFKQPPNRFTFCPLVAVARQFDSQGQIRSGCDYTTARTILDMDYSQVMKIVAAADNNRTHDSVIRKRLLEACYL